MEILDLLEKPVTKAEKCIAMIKWMADSMNFPIDARSELNNLDLSLATEFQVEMFFIYLSRLTDQYRESCRKYGGDIFGSVRDIQIIN